MPRKRQELTGRRFGRLTVTGFAGFKEDGRQKISVWECRCDCGKTCVVPGYILRSGRRKSCGCMRVSSSDLAGMRFGKLTIIEEDKGNTGTLRKVICRCDCGNQKSIAFRELKSGRITSCGCDIAPVPDKAGFFERQYDERLEEKKNTFQKGDISGIQTLEDWVYVWTRAVLPNVVKESTCLMYGETMERHILPFLGFKQMKDLTSDVIREWLSRLQKAQIPGTIEGRMTEGTVRNTLSVLSGCMRDAQKYGLIVENPCLEAAWSLPKKNVWESNDWLNDEQISMLEPAVMQYRDENGYPAGIIFQLVLYAGLMMSEAAALRWEDVDLGQKVLRIRYFLVVKKETNGTTKTAELLEKAVGRRKREIPIPDFLVQNLSRIMCEYKPEPKAFVVNTSIREPVRTDRMRSVLLRRAQSAGLGKVTPRMLRDTYAIHAVQAGATSDMVAELMGFASAQQVVRRYMPRSSSDKRNLVNQMYKYHHIEKF